MRVSGLLTFAALLCGAAAAESVSLESLLAEMTNLDRLAAVSRPAYVTRQFSSYDRNSTDPAVQDEGNWFANGDRGHVLRAEEGAWGTEHVLMDAAGPGAVVRFWSANANDGGVVRVYLDGAAEPAIDMPLSAMLGGMVHPFLPPVSGIRSKGWNSFLPIPYAKHCKITVSRHDIYYQINYRTYAPDTAVETFSMDQVAGLADRLGAVMAGLSSPATLPLPEGVEVVPFTIPLGPGQYEENAMAPEQPGAICGLQMRVKSDDPETALRGCVMEISFDGNPVSVSAPLGDFFGTAPGANPHQSLPSGVLQDGTLYSRWLMPYQRTITVSLTNRSDIPVTLEGEMHVIRDRPWTDDTMYFHAKWRAVRDLPTRPMIDWNYLETGGGPGRFAGVMLHIANPVPQWWGEGDEKIYVDGEAFPSHFGTGTEDYFGYAWCSNEPFTHAYHNQPRCDGPGNFGHTCVSRFHIMDDIPWTESFKFDMEMWHWNAETTVTQAVTAYWYAKAGGTDNFPPIDTGLLPPPDLKEVMGVEGALEGEAMAVVSITGGDAAPQEGVVWNWSRVAHLWWKGAKPGDTLALGFNVEKAGRYAVIARMTKANDFGIHQLSINGAPAGDPIDFWNKDVIGDDPVNLGVFDLKEGQNLFGVEVIGANEKAIKAHMFGLDYLLLKEE